MRGEGGGGVDGVVRMRIEMAGGGRVGRSVASGFQLVIIKLNK